MIHQNFLIKSITIAMTIKSTKTKATPTITPMTAELFFVLLILVVGVDVGRAIGSSGNDDIFDNENSGFPRSIDKLAISNNTNNNNIDDGNANNRESSHIDRNIRSSANFVDKSTFVPVDTNDVGGGDDGVGITSVEETKNESKNIRKLRRGKRYLDFVKGTRVSWRTTVKNNILQVNTLWGYGFGFRTNYPFPDKADRLRPFFKRDLLHSTIDMLDGHGLDGRACILKSYCTAQLDGQSSIGGGMIYKLLKMLLTLDEHDKRPFPFLNLDNCRQILHSHCPLSFNSISPFTDDV